MEFLLGFNCSYMDFNSISIGFRLHFIFKWIYICFSVKLNRMPMALKGLLEAAIPDAFNKNLTLIIIKRFFGHRIILFLSEEGGGWGGRHLILGGLTSQRIQDHNVGYLVITPTNSYMTLHVSFQFDSPALGKCPQP